MSAGHKRYNYSRPARGFTLIEVLISVVILAIGVSGVAALQMATYRQLQTSHNFTNASILAGELADRMSANSAQALADAYNHNAAEDNVKDCSAVACDAAEVAAYDIAVWQARVTGNIADGPRTPGSLPAGSGTVARIGATNEFTVTVRWDDDLSGSEGTDCVALDPDADQDPDDLDCYVLVVGF